MLTFYQFSVEFKRKRDVLPGSLRLSCVKHHKGVKEFRWGYVYAVVFLRPAGVSNKRLLEWLQNG